MKIQNKSGTKEQRMKNGFNQLRSLLKSVFSSAVKRLTQRLTSVKKASHTI